MEKELKDYEINQERIKNGEAVFTEDDLETGINIKISKDIPNDEIDNITIYLSAWYDNDGEGIYFEIRDEEGTEIDGGVQLFGLENSQNLILQDNLVKDLIQMSSIETIYELDDVNYLLEDGFKRLPNGNIVDNIDIEEFEEDI